MKKIILLAFLLSTGCAQSMWIMRDYDNLVGQIRYLDGEDREHAIMQAKVFCGDKTPHITKDGHYQSVFRQGLTLEETAYSYIDFKCEDA